jgi:ParB-like chromosome segregation protein Spo0J
LVKYYNEVQLVATDAVNKNDWNPNSVSKKMQETIIDDIRQNGFIGEIVVQKYNERLEKNNVIINGEHRYDALKKLGHDLIPVIILDIDDKKAKTLSIRLNREHGELVPDKISEILKDLSPDKDLTFLQTETGIDISELNVLTEINFEEIEIQEDKGKKQSTEQSVQCPNCGNNFKIYK